MAVVVFSGAQKARAGTERLDIAAGRVDELVGLLAERYPALADELRSSAVAIDGVIHGEAEYLGLMPNSEVCFVPRVSAG